MSNSNFGRSIVLAVAWFAVVVLVGATLVPIEMRPVSAASAHLERFLAFATAGALVVLAYPKRRFLSMLGLIGLAILLEFLQQLTLTRHGQVADAEIKVAGAFVGWLLGCLAHRYVDVEKFRLRRPTDKSPPRPFDTASGG